MNASTPERCQIHGRDFDAACRWCGAIMRAEAKPVRVLPVPAGEAELRSALEAFWSTFDEYQTKDGREPGEQGDVEIRVILSDFASAVEWVLPRAALASEEKSVRVERRPWHHGLNEEDLAVIREDEEENTVRVEEPAGDPKGDFPEVLYSDGQVTGKRVAQTANADVATHTGVGPLDRARMEAYKPLPVPVGDETEALRAEIARLEQALSDARYLGDNHHNAAACPHCGDLLGKALARVAGLEAREARLRRAAEAHIAALDATHTRDMGFRSEETGEWVSMPTKARRVSSTETLDELRAALAALPHSVADSDARGLA